MIIFLELHQKFQVLVLVGIEKKIRQIHKEAFESTETVLPIGGIYRYRKKWRNTQYQGKLIHLLQSAVGSNSYDAYKKYVRVYIIYHQLT